MTPHPLQHLYARASSVLLIVFDAAEVSLAKGATIAVTCVGTLRIAELHLDSHLETRRRSCGYKVCLKQTILQLHLT
jgi:hypothetical protein